VIDHKVLVTTVLPKYIVDYASRHNRGTFIAFQSLDYDFLFYIIPPIAHALFTCAHHPATAKHELSL
jgi:hypothetical protein